MVAAVLPEWRPRRTLIDLYTEKDQMKWYYRVGATTSSMMLVVGFLIFPSAFIQSYNANITPSSSLTGALVLVILAYTASTILSLTTKSWLFQLDILYLPHLVSSALGFISIIYALATHDYAFSNSLPSAYYAIAALTLSIASVLIYAILSLLTFRKVYIVRARDAMHRRISSSKATEYLPESDQQRKQLLRLLLQQEDHKTANPESATQTTFKIDWPGSKSQSRRNSTSTLNYIPRFAGTTMYGSRRSSTIGPLADHLTSGIERVPFTIEEEPIRFVPRIVTSRASSMSGPPLDHLTGGIERVPTLTHEESPVSSASQGAGSDPVSSMAQSGLSGSSDPTPLMPVAYIAPLQNARYMGLESPVEPATPLSALPSYRVDAHPSLNISIRPVTRFEENRYPLEKKDPAVYAIPAFKEPRRIQEGPYRMAEPSAVTASNVARDTRRITLELADRGPEGTRLRPELESQVLSASIRVV